MHAPELTVLFASRNGEAVLPRTLEGYRLAQTPPVAWEMVIADNGSTDSTRQIIDAFSQDLPIKLVQQPAPGKNRALNTAIPAIEGRLVVVTDDDAIPHAMFLAAWAKFLDSRQDCDLFGGSIEPLFDVPPPKWMLGLKRHFAFMFSERDLPEGPVDPAEIYGPNMAVRTSVFDRGLRFDENLGPNALDPNYPMGGETEFCRRAASLGARSWFAREPRVYHVVRPDQLESSAWTERAYRTGRGRAHQMFQRGEILHVPTPSIADRLAVLSPMPGHRLSGLCARHLARGFRDECTKRLGG